MRDSQDDRAQRIAEATQALVAWVRGASDRGYVPMATLRDLLAKLDAAERGEP
jgi:hypothetical protein